MAHKRALLLEESEKINYWVIRNEIIQAVQDDDQDRIRYLASAHPGIFQEMVNQAVNANRKNQAWITLH